MEIRVIVGAYACHPLRGSEQGVGWNWIRGLAEYCRLDVITAEHQGNREAIADVCAHEPGFAERVHFHFLPDFIDEAWARHSFLMSYFQPIYYRYYRRWMWMAYEVAKDLVVREHFDLAHQLTMIGYREPGYLWQLPLPFVWGPIGGTQNVPWRFLPSLGLVEGGRHAARNLINLFQFRTHRRFRQALRRSVAMIVVAPDVQRHLLKVHGKASIVVHEVFTISSHPQARVRKVLPGTPLRLVFSGLHISRKGLPLVLRALARIGRNLSWQLDVLGAGVMTATWKHEAARLGLGDRILWHGQIARAGALRVMSSADVMVFTSLLEATATVIAEAMSLGLPVVTLNHHGMADFVDDSCGVRLAVTNPKQLVHDLSGVLQRLMQDPDLVTRLSQGALARAWHYSAEAQIPRVVELYREALQSSVVSS